MKKKAKENFESNLDNILDNSTNPKTYWKIMKMLIKSNNLTPLKVKLMTQLPTFL